jgi:hypothetical protein
MSRGRFQHRSIALYGWTRQRFPKPSDRYDLDPPTIPGKNAEIGLRMWLRARLVMQLAMIRSASVLRRSAIGLT